MPAKNALKTYLENGYYHIYNRGVAKGPTFLDHQDFVVFMSYLKDYLLSPKPPTIEEAILAPRPTLRKNYYQEITLISFVLMPNHFHLLLKQKKFHSVESFMRSLLTRYVKYFNKRHNRVGHLFQDVYKGILIDRDEYLWWLTRYIHRNPKELLKSNEALDNYTYSSYPAYLKKQHLDWIENNEILDQVRNYREFVEDEAPEKQPEALAELVFEETESL